MVISWTLANLQSHATEIQGITTAVVLFVLMMDSSKSELDFEFLPSFRVYKDGTIERLRGTEIAPPSIDDPQTNVSSKDILISPESDLSVRLYLPKIVNHHQNEKFPLLVYFHGGGFCVYTAFSPIYHNYLSSLVSEANIVVVSVNYRRAPEHPLPIAYEDSWNALQWVASHCSGKGTETWLTDHADFDKIFLGGDSAGANIAHHMAMWIESNDQLVFNISILGIALVHPMFWGSEVIGSETTDPQKKAKLDRLWPIVSPSKPDLDDPWINPVADGAPSLSKLGCIKVLVCVAEKDVLRDRGRLYYESLSKCGWEGVVEIAETEGENHVFHLYNPGCEKAKDFLRRVAAFFNQEL